MSETLETLKVVIEGDLKKYKKANADAIRETRETTEKINRELGKIKTPQIGSQGTMKQISNMNRFIKQSMKDMISLKIPKSITADLRNYVREAQIAAGVRVYTDDYQRLSDDIEKTEKELSALKAAKEVFPESEIHQETEDYKDLQKCISDTRTKLNQLLERQEKMQASGVSYDSKTWKKLQYDIEETRKTLDAYKQDEINMREDGSAWENSKEWQRLNASIERAERSLESYRMEQVRMKASGTDTAFVSGGKISNYAKTVSATANATTSQVTAKMREIRSSINETVQRIPLVGKVSRAAGNIMSKAFQGMKAVLNSVTPAIKKAGGAFASLIQKFISGIPGIDRADKSLKRMRNTGRGLNGIFGTLGMTARFMFASFLITGTISAVADGMKNLAQYSDQTNASLSMLLSSLTQLKNSFAAAFAPILNVVAPILNTMIRLIVDAVTAIGMLFASLTGQKMFTKAKQVNQDYAASLNSNATSADKANEANKKLQRTLLGFDEINKLDDNSDASSGTGGGNLGGLSPSDMFEEVPITNAISEFAEKLKEAWRAVDFTEIGFIVAQKLNGALENIPWEKIQRTLNKIAKSAATFLNGFIAGANWPLIGSTISKGINTAFSTANTFAQTFRWKSLGTAVGNGINSALKDLNWNQIKGTIKNIVSGITGSVNSFLKSADWNLIGSTLSQLFNSKLEILHTAVHGFSWKQFGISLGNLINGAIKDIDTIKLANTTSGLLNGIADSIINFDKTIEWGKLSEKLYEGINHFIKQTDWKKLGFALSSLIKDLLNEIFITIQGTDWEEVGGAIGEFLAGIDWKGILSGIVDIIKETAKSLPQIALGLYDAIKEGLEGATWEDIAETIFSLLEIAITIKAVKWAPKLIKSLFGAGTAAKAAGDAAGTAAGGGLIAGVKSAVSKAGGLLGIAKAASGIGAFAYTLDKTSITTDANDMHDDAVIGFKTKLLELKEQMEALTAAGKNNSEEFQNLKNQYDLLNGALEKATGEAYNYSISTERTTRAHGGLGGSFGTVTEKAASYKDTLKEIPGSVKTNVQAETEKATQQVNIFKNIAQKLGLTKFKTYFEAITENATENVKKLTGEADLASGLKQLLFTADTTDAEEKTANMEKKVDNVKTKSSFDMKIDTAEAANGLDLFTVLKLLVMKALLGSMKLELNTEDATEDLEIFGEAVKAVATTKTVRFIADITSFLGINNTMYELGQDAAKSFRNGMKSVHIPTPHMYISSWRSHSLGNGGYTYTPNFSVQWYRHGGFVDGELWGMNETGNPEMVGKVGNKTAVTNNAIISEAIRSAVVDGMMEVFLATRSGGEENNPPVIEFVYKTNDEVLYKRVVKGKKKAERRYSVVIEE